jgi:hypothetical protein
MNAILGMLSKPLVKVDDASAELDLSRVSHDAIYVAARLEVAIGKAVARLAFWVGASALILLVAARVMWR